MALNFTTEEELEKATRRVRDSLHVGKDGERRYARAARELDITLRDEWGWGPIHLRSTDVGPGGVFLSSDLLFKEGEGFILEFTSPATGERVRVWSRVVRVAHDDSASAAGRPGMAFEFVDLSPDHRRALAAYISQSTRVA